VNLGKRKGSYSHFMTCGVVKREYPPYLKAEQALLEAQLAEPMRAEQAVLEPSAAESPRAAQELAWQALLPSSQLDTPLLKCS